jgi:hypothetical protein
MHTSTTKEMTKPCEGSLKQTNLTDRSCTIPLGKPSQGLLPAKVKMIPILILIMLILSTVLPTQIFAKFGFGVMLGDPTGLSIKQWKSAKNAVAGGVAWSLKNDGSLHVHADYVHHNYRLFEGAFRSGSFPAYFGMGVRLIINDRSSRGESKDDSRIGIRFPLGVNYLFADAPFDIFFELVPIFEVIPETTMSMNASIGARIYFR